MYADGVTHVLCHSDHKFLSDICNGAIRTMDEWSVANNLVLNRKKTCFKRFKSPHTRFAAPSAVLQISGEVLESPELVSDVLGLKYA